MRLVDMIRSVHVTQSVRKIKLRNPIGSQDLVKLRHPIDLQDQIVPTEIIPCKDTDPVCRLYEWAVCPIMLDTYLTTINHKISTHTRYLNQNNTRNIKSVISSSCNTRACNMWTWQFKNIERRCTATKLITICLVNNVCLAIVDKA